MENVLEMVKREDFDHRHPGYPGLHFYLQRAVFQAMLASDGRPLASIPRADFYLAARRVTLAAGAATAALVFFIGLKVSPRWGGGLAAALTALSPLAFRESAVVNPDLMLGLFAVLAVLTAQRLRESPTLLRHAVAGAAVGLATAVKYTGAATVVSYGLAVWLASERRASRALAGVGAAVAAFALSSPYTFWSLMDSARGLERHVGYYGDRGGNAALQVLEALSSRGLGIPGALLALVGAAAALRSREPKRLVLLAFPVAYLLPFAFFDRAFPRHALPLVPFGAVLAALGVSLFPGRARSVLALAILALPTAGSLDLVRRSGKPSPADRALAWARAAIPEGSRVLEDQWTPRLDPERFHVHRLRVEEQVFLGNFDWVLYSGYPPGIEVEGMREVQRFSTGDALGAEIAVYQVPERSALMGTTLAANAPAVTIDAGELSYFGEGFSGPRPGAFGTERLSRGGASEIFFVLREPGALEIELTLAAAADPVEVALVLNGGLAGSVTLKRTEPETAAVEVRVALLREGLNRLELRYGETVRMSRREREAAIRFYRMRLSRR